MPPITGIRARETTSTAGTGPYDLGGAVYGSQTLVAAIGDGNQVYYLVSNVDPANEVGDWELGIGTVTDATPDTLSRDTILASSNSGAAVNWDGSTKRVLGVFPTTAGNIMLGVNDLAELQNLTTARTNLGLGNVATEDDGPGSTIDADTLDSLHATSFVRNAEAATVSADDTHSGDRAFEADVSASGVNDFTNGRVIAPFGADRWAT